MPHRRRVASRLRREARRLALDQAFWDRERGEGVSLWRVEVLGVEEGEVLYSLGGYVSPSVSSDPHRESYVWLKVHGLL